MRAYPWRGVRDPYRVLVSEVMLQQTQALRVVPIYRRFVRTYPTVSELASASLGDVLRAWDGLGYNRRAAALSEAARVVVRDHGARVPSDPRALQQLPGVGPYTAAAIASIGYGVPVAAVDTNVARIVARVFFGRDANHVAPGRVRDVATRWVNRDQPGTWNQALMDLGREVCKPRPRCEVCPLATRCTFRRKGRLLQPPGRKASQPFEGSFRQVRGGVLRTLRARPVSPLGVLAREAGEPLDRVKQAVAALAAEGLVEAGPAALAGRPGGLVRLPV
jgi:A/G-specific adenine glycosylase